MQHLDIEVYGLVQGVSFRYYTNEKARELGIKGYVRNRMDGSVYIEAEADEVQLKKFVDWCQQGPAFARVSKVLTSENQMKNYPIFEIRY